MGSHKELLLDSNLIEGDLSPEMWGSPEPSEADLERMQNREILFQIERIEDIIEAIIDRCKYYGEAPTKSTLETIMDELKNVRKRYE